MTDLTKLTIAEAKAGLRNKDFSAVELTQAYIKNMEAKREINAFVCETAEEALEQAKVSQAKIEKGVAGNLEGIPLGIKDLFCTKGIATTACSNILKGFVPQYESSITQNLLDAGAVFLGKLNLDEFAMGGSNENSAFGPVINPWSKDVKLVAGGSSGGSAAAVAAEMCAGATGTDTGGLFANHRLFAVLRELSLHTEDARAMVQLLLLHLWIRQGLLLKMSEIVQLCLIRWPDMIIKMLLQQKLMCLILRNFWVVISKV